MKNKNPLEELAELLDQESRWLSLTQINDALHMLKEAADELCELTDPTILLTSKNPYLRKKGKEKQGDYSTAENELYYLRGQNNKLEREITILWKFLFKNAVLALTDPDPEIRAWGERLQEVSGRYTLDQALEMRSWIRG